MIESKGSGRDAVKIFSRGWFYLKGDVATAENRKETLDTNGNGIEQIRNIPKYRGLGGPWAGFKVKIKADLEEFCFKKTECVSATGGIGCRMYRVTPNPAKTSRCSQSRKDGPAIIIGINQSTSWALPRKDWSPNKGNCIY